MCDIDYQPQAGSPERCVTSATCAGRSKLRSEKKNVVIGLTRVRGRTECHWQYHLHTRLSLWTEDLAFGADGDFREQVLQGLRGVSHGEVGAETCDGWFVETQNHHEIRTLTFREYLVRWKIFPLQWVAGNERACMGWTKESTRY